MYVVYHDTLEEKALALMGEKMRAAQLLYGDEVGGAIVPDDGRDFLAELARRVLEGEKFQDLEGLFAQENARTTGSYLGSPTAQSPRMAWDAYREYAVRVGAKVVRRNGNSKKVKHAPGQPSLPGFEKVAA